MLLHPDINHSLSGTIHWLTARQVSSHHHVYLTSESDITRLARFLNGNAAIGLVLGGAEIGYQYAKPQVETWDKLRQP